MRDLSLDLVSRTSLVGSAESGRALLGHLEALHPGWLPDRWGQSEPLRERYEGEPTDHMWGADLFWRARDRATGYASLRFDAWPHAFLSIDADSARTDLAGAIELLKRLAAEFEGDYGFLHTLTREDEAFLEGTPAPPHFDEDGPFLMVNTEQLMLCLPDLFWANVLGPPYAELFGAERLASAPAHVVEEIAPGTFYLQLSERIEDVHEEPEALDRARVEIKEHLGADAFWNPEVGTEYPYQAPRFTAEEEAAEPAGGGSDAEPFTR